MTETFILSLIDKIGGSPIAELDLDDGSAHLVLRKYSAPGNNGPALPASPAETADSAVHLSIPANRAEESSEGEKITSPIVATYYAAPGPDAPAFVSPGSKAKAGDTLCILEAMKMMNRLEAEFDCEIIKTHAVSGDLVEYGQTLFTVKRL
jgi:acetyl-CoA carboxylase biotin carboxyl carrier protein